MQFFALVTGASTGIGPKIGECFAKDQNPLILVSRQVQVLEKVLHDLIQVSKHSIQLISMELSHAQPVNELFWRTKDLGLAGEYLVNDAGFSNLGNIQDLL